MVNNLCKGSGEYLVGQFQLVQTVAMLSVCVCVLRPLCDLMPISGVSSW